MSNIINKTGIYAYRIDKDEILGPENGKKNNCSSVCTVAIIVTVDCGDLQEPHNGRVYYTSTTIGSMANYSCSAECHANNYTIECENGSSTASWSVPQPQCQGIRT